MDWFMVSSVCDKVCTTVQNSINPFRRVNKDGRFIGHGPGPKTLGISER